MLKDGIRLPFKGVIIFHQMGYGKWHIVQVSCLIELHPAKFTPISSGNYGKCQL